MSSFILDSNVLIDIARNTEGAVAKRFESKAIGEVWTSIVVSGEIHYGMRKRPDARSNPRMRFLLDSLHIDPLATEIAGLYANIRADMERRGCSISPNDYWIAAHAISRDAVLVTGDRMLHDAGIAELKLEDWRGELLVQEQS